MTDKELKQKTTDELQRLQASYKKIAIERINKEDYPIAIEYIKRADKIYSILFCRENGFKI